jgi:hypothetical protein
MILNWLLLRIERDWVPLFLKGVVREYSATTRSLQYSIRETALALAVDGSGTSLLVVAWGHFESPGIFPAPGTWPIAGAA